MDQASVQPKHLCCLALKEGNPQLPAPICGSHVAVIMWQSYVLFI